MELGIDTYATVAEADAYFQKLISGEEWLSLSVDEKELRLMTATALIDGYAFIGTRRTPEQLLKFPRTGKFYDPRKECLVDLLLVNYPDILKQATMEQALYSVNNVECPSGSVSVAGVLSISGMRPEPKSSLKSMELLKPLLDRAADSWKVRVAW